jgi:hypothetical protein
MNTFTKVGLDALLTPENCAVLLIDHQPSQLANVNSHEPAMVINNATGLAKTARAFGVPTILTTIAAKRGGEIFSQIQAVFPDQKPIDRSFINSWEDRRVVEAVKNTLPMLSPSSSSSPVRRRCTSRVFARSRMRQTQRWRSHRSSAVLLRCCSPSAC